MITRDGSCGLNVHNAGAHLVDYVEGWAWLEMRDIRYYAIKFEPSGSRIGMQTFIGVCMEHAPEKRISLNRVKKVKLCNCGMIGYYIMWQKIYRS